MKVLIDTNIILDVLLDRKPFSDNASNVIAKIERSEIAGLICATTLTTIHYLSAKALGSKAADRHLKTLISLFEVAPVNRIVIENAVSSNFKDFEDAVLHAAACHACAECIVTRDIGGFKGSTLPVFTPSEFLNVLESLAPKP
jgi:predicted nucleic acid-binding protein